MFARSELDVLPGVGPPQVERLWIREMLWIPIGRPSHTLHHLPWRELYPLYDNGACDIACAALHGGLPTQGFLNRMREQARIGTDRLILRPMAEQSPDGVRQHGCGGLQSAKDDHPGSGKDLLFP